MKKLNLRELIKTERLYFDGGFGTALQAMGLRPGEGTEEWNLTHPEKIVEVHRSYIEAGCNIINANTFGINCRKQENYVELMEAAMACARKAKELYGGDKTFVTLDLGPTGSLLEPLGELSFEEAVEIYAANINAAKNLGADLICIETMNDCLETKAAVIAAKENCDLPIFVTNVYDEAGKLMTGADPEAMIAMLESLGVDALGMNCSLGPKEMLKHIDRFVNSSSLPIIVNPNAGLPEVVDGKTIFNVGPEEFADYMKKMAEKGACILGGCCGTTPEHMKALIAATRDIEYKIPEYKEKTVVSSYTHAVEIGNSPILIGERINPTGKPKLKEALRQGNVRYLLNEGVRQAEAGVQILDVNVGLPEIDEGEMMLRTVKALQAVKDTPLQLDSADPKVLEKSMRIYNGKPLINSVTGEDEKMEQIFPLIKKYGGAVIALTMDKNGIPESAEERAAIAERIAAKAAEYGIPKKDIIVDPLALTVSSDQRSALVTLKSLELIKAMGLKTSLGVSNISFGLPARNKVNSTFFACALEKGLDCAIMNPFMPEMMDVYYAYRALHDMDPACGDFITYAAGAETKPAAAAPVTRDSLSACVIRGMKDEAVAAAEEMLKTTAPLDVINGEIIPALDAIGKDFEAKKVFLPQLLMSAEAASAAFEEIKKKLPAGDKGESKAVVLATVKGDIHDIGKNIVKVIMESYGFTVYDLGRDVAPEAVVKTAVEKNCKLVGLSALMTTTVPAMAETVKLLHEADPEIKVMVGGAVLNEEYAKMIEADFYGADAMASVKIGEDFYKA